MKQRTSNPNNNRWRTYEGRDVCERWHTFENFYADMGDPPDGMTLERKNNSLGYSPENCVWATQVEQQRNRVDTKLTANDAVWIRRKRTDGMTYKAIANEYGISATHVCDICKGRYWKEEV